MVAAEDLNSYTITSTIPGVDSTSITVDTSGLTFDWADVTLEVYDVDECLKFPKVQLFYKISSIRATLRLNDRSK